MDDVAYMLQQMQLQKVKGELLALQSTCYDPMRGITDKYTTVSTMIGQFIHELENEIG